MKITIAQHRYTHNKPIHIQGVFLSGPTGGLENYKSVRKHSMGDFTLSFLGITLRFKDDHFATIFQNGAYL